MLGAAVALCLGESAFGLCVLIGLKLFGAGQDLLTLWIVTLVGSALAGAITAAVWTGFVAGWHFWTRGALAGALSTGAIFAVPLMPAIILWMQSITLLVAFVPFLVVATFVGVKLPGSAQTVRTQEPTTRPSRTNSALRPFFRPRLSSQLCANGSADHSDPRPIPMPFIYKDFFRSFWYQMDGHCTPLLLDRGGVSLST
jgi:hypothetical protein